MDKRELAIFRAFSSDNAIREKHCVSDFERRIIADSQIIPGKKIETGRHWQCPSCSIQMPEPEHGKVWECDCGLKMMALGNALFCAKENDDER